MSREGAEADKDEGPDRFTVGVGTIANSIPLWSLYKYSIVTPTQIKPILLILRPL